MDDEEFWLQDRIETVYENYEDDDASDEDSEVEVISPRESSFSSMKSDSKSDMSNVVKSECGICTCLFTQEKMFVPIYCGHKICRECAEQYYESQVRNRSILDVVCPYPSCTDLSMFDAARKQEYFALTSTQLKGVLSIEVMDLFEQKLRDWSLSGLTDFMWCPKCENGLIVDDISSQNYMTCTHCGCNICTECRKVWTREHFGLSCIQYQKWLEANDTSTQEKKLDKYLVKHGIGCPKCKIKFIKPSGGCLHLKCPMSCCRHEFCEGCLQPFNSGKNCMEPECVRDMGLHAHHPRNCFYFLRDWEPVKLQQLLTSHHICFETESLGKVNSCQTFEQKETLDGFVDEPCGKVVEPYHAGYCRKHYIRYLGQLVLYHGIDPIVEYDAKELELYFNKHNILLPVKVDNQNEYRQLMINIIQELGDVNIYRTTLTAKEKAFDLTKDSDSESEDGIFEDACGASAPSLEVLNASLWRCAFCTFDNSLDTPICEICCRTQTTNEHFEVFEDGIECMTCTLINQSDSTICIACAAHLE